MKEVLLSQIGSGSSQFFFLLPILRFNLLYPFDFFIILGVFYYCLMCG